MTAKIRHQDIMKYEDSVCIQDFTIEADTYAEIHDAIENFSQSGKFQNNLEQFLKNQSYPDFDVEDMYIEIKPRQPYLVNAVRNPKYKNNSLADNTMSNFWLCHIQCEADFKYYFKKP